MNKEKEDDIVELTHKIVFHVYVKADNWNEALKKAVVDVSKFSCHKIDMEVL